MKVTTEENVQKVEKLVLADRRTLLWQTDFTWTFEYAQPVEQASCKDFFVIVPRWFGVDEVGKKEERPLKNLKELQFSVIEMEYY